MKLKPLSILKQFFLPLATIIGYTATFILSRDNFFIAVHLVISFLKEMITILPAIALLSGMITVWISKERIIALLGHTSGFRGKITALAVGAFSAGPIYAAFPVCKTLMNKGASVSNIVIILSSWAVIKAPMFLVESRFLGIEFASYRYLLTLPFIFFISWFMGKAVNTESAIPIREEEADIVFSELPGLNCKGCGYESCKAFAEAVASGKTEKTACIALG
ncbi:MAG: (Fe-S)-binding protein [Spirochaetia bacterium]